MIRTEGAVVGTLEQAGLGSRIILGERKGVAFRNTEGKGVGVGMNTAVLVGQAWAYILRSYCLIASFFIVKQ